jgi:hypothetical protein
MLNSLYKDSWLSRTSAYDSSRHTGSYRIGREVFVDYRSGTDLSTLCNSDPRQNDNSCPKVAIIFYDDWRKFQPAVEYRLIDTFVCMDGSNNFHARTNTHISADEKTASTVEKALLANPGTFSYNHPVFIVSLEKSIVTDVDMLAYLNIFGMKDKYTGFKDYTFA